MCRKIIKSIIALTVIILSVGCAKKETKGEEARVNAVETEEATEASITMDADIEMQNDSMEKRQIEVFLVTESASDPHVKAFREGALTAVKELGGINITFAATTEKGTAEEQVKILDEAIEKQVDFIVLSSKDEEHANLLLEKAREYGINVILTGVTTVENDSYTNLISVDDVESAYLAADALNEVLEGKGQIFIINEGDETKEMEERESAFLTKLSTDYSSIGIIGSAYIEADVEDIKDLILKVVEDNPEISAFYSCSERLTSKISNILKDNGLWENVKLVGFGDTPELMRIFTNGELEGAAIMEHFGTGYESIRAAYHSMRGTADSKEYSATAEALKTSD